MTMGLVSLAGIDVSRETIDKLEALSGLILKWTKSINLIASGSTADIWNRHIVDSAQIYHLSRKTWTNWIDLGSGGGLPALVVAIMDSHQQPMTLVESDQRKCLFLNTVRRELGLNIKVINQRIEKAELDRADVLSARALAPLPDLLHYANNLLEDNGIALFSKGERFQEELDRARQDWHFECTAHQSKTNPASRVLEISRIRRREP